MGSSTAALSGQAFPAATPLRLLCAWHLLSLDAPTVAFCWLLLFAEALRVPQPLPAAAALASAVWLVYVADRILDARRDPGPSWPGTPQDALFGLYRSRTRMFVAAGFAIAGLAVALLFALPHALMESWVLLTAPLLLYAAAVHLLRLSARWKAISVGIFFAVAVALPAAVHGGISWPLASAAVAFGGLCRANCAVLRASSQRLRIVLVLAGVAALLPLRFAEARAIAPACLLALVLLLLLVLKREVLCARFGWLCWRALVDAALVAPALLCAACIPFVR